MGNTTFYYGVPLDSSLVFVDDWLALLVDGGLIGLGRNALAGVALVLDGDMGRTNQNSFTRRAIDVPHLKVLLLFVLHREGHSRAATPVRTLI